MVSREPRPRLAPREADSSQRDPSDEDARSARGSGERKSERLVIRISPSQRALIAAAAREDDLDEATWARRALLQAARKAGDRSSG